MIIRQISKNKKKALTKPVLDEYNESQPAEKIDLPEDAEYVEPKDSTIQESKSTENSTQEKRAGDVPEFFLDKEEKSEEKK